MPSLTFKSMDTAILAHSKAMRQSEKDYYRVLKTNILLAAETTSDAYGRVLPEADLNALSNLIDAITNQTALR